MLTDTLHNPTVHQLAGGTAASTVSLLSSTDLNTVKAVIISAILSGVAQLVIALYKKLIAKINGNSTAISAGNLTPNFPPQSAQSTRVPVAQS